MLDKRYQIFISTSGREMQPERMILAQTLVGMGFFLGDWNNEHRFLLRLHVVKLMIAIM